jgi:hypothetical protein
MEKTPCKIPSTCDMSVEQINELIKAVGEFRLPDGRVVKVTKWAPSASAGDAVRVQIEGILLPSEGIPEGVNFVVHSTQPASPVCCVAQDSVGRIDRVEKPGTTWTPPYCKAEKEQ